MDTSQRAETPPLLPRRRANNSNVCTQCRRQKQKCDRQTPCANCIRREIPQMCHLPIARYPRASWTPCSQASPFRQGSVTRIPSIVSETPPISRTAALAPLPETQTRFTGSSHAGQIWNSRGAPSYHGSSYFGHQSAASMMQMESPDLPVGMNGIHANVARSGLQRDEKGPYDHIWELVGYLPRRKPEVDHLVQRYLDELSNVHDCVDEATFRASYDSFWNRKWGDDDLTTVDLRWLGLLFIVLAFAVLLDSSLVATIEAQRDSEKTSVQFFWACRKAIVLAPTFTGESPDLVRAGILVSRYLVYFGRKTESWLTSSFAIRMAQAQGMHIDGEGWGFPVKVLESRRRLWCKLHSLDRSISLAVGRPYTIHGKHCTRMKMRNIWVDDMTAEEAGSTTERPLTEPTPTLYYRYQQQLSEILGDIHDECYGLTPVTSSYSAYEKVLRLDSALIEWATALPSYFQLESPDISMDDERHFLYWQRIYLHSAYHFARITLHRTYMLLESITDRFQYSRDACISSACADLKLKLELRYRSMADRLKAGAAMHNLFNSALVLGIIAVRSPMSQRMDAILGDLAAYCEKQRADLWVNEFVLAEVKVIELCIATAKKLHRDHMERRLSAQSAGEHQSELPSQEPTAMPDEPSTAWNTSLSGENWLENWFGPARNFSEPIDSRFWEDLVGTLEARQ